MFMKPLLIAAVALAATLASAQPTPTKEATGDRFIAGGTVRHDTPVDGDLIGVGGDVELNAAVKGDVVVMGGDVRLRAPVGSDVYAAGGTVTIESSVGGNARIAGGNAEVTGTGSVTGNLSIAGGDVMILGPVKGNVHAAGGNVLIDSEIGGDVSTGAGTLELGPNARITGKLKYTGPDDIRRHPDAQVSGGIVKKEVRTRETRRHVETVTHDRSFSLGGWLWTLGLIGLAALLAAAFPAATKRLGGELRENTGLVFLLGFCALVGLPIFAILLMVTIIGLPLALIVVLLYFLLLLLGYVAIAVVMGDLALNRYKSEMAARLGWRVGAAVLAMLALAVLGRIPFLGGLVVFAALLAGIGAIMLSLRPRAAAPTATA
jgi:cytoskeletal protein CcmA (bactofilin family)